MAASFTVVKKTSVGDMRTISGTFTTDSGDSSISLANATHGLNYIDNYQFTVNAGGIAAQEPKVSISSGTMTIVFDNTEGYDGTWSVTGR